MRFKKSKTTAEEELVALIIEGYDLLLWIREDYQKKTRDEKIIRGVEINQAYQARITPWMDKVQASLNSIFPTPLEANSFILTSFPPSEEVSSQQKLENSYPYLRLEAFHNTLRKILETDLGRYTDLPLAMRLYVEDIDSFRNVRDVNPGMVASYLTNGYYLDISEEAIQRAIEEIINEPFHKKDWGGEANDLYTSNIVVRGGRVATAFLLKGNGLRKRKLEMKNCGKNGDQVIHLFQSPAQLFIVQYVGEITESLIRHVEHEVELLRHQDKQAWFCIMNGQDTARVLYAYNKLQL
jgi:hypothetical protein